MISELIRTQVFEFIVMFWGGAGLGLLHSAYSYLKSCAMKRVLEKWSAALAVSEIAFYVLAALFITKYLDYASHGAISVHNFLALATGVLLWRKAFYGKIKC